MSDKGYVHDEVLVSADWVAANLGQTDKIRLVESNEDLLLYSTGHIPNAVHIDYSSGLFGGRRVCRVAQSAWYWAGYDGCFLWGQE